MAQALVTNYPYECKGEKFVQPPEALVSRAFFDQQKIYLRQVLDRIEEVVIFNKWNQ